MIKNSKLKSFAINFLPPIVLRGLLVVSGRRNKWSGSYPDWASAVSASSGYDADAIFDMVKKAAGAVRDGKALWERDSTCFYHEEYNWQLLACLMTVAVRSGGALHVLDFGGALGSTYMQHRKLFDELNECSWSVVEQSHFVVCGKDGFATDTLGFYDSIEQCFSERPINVVLFSSVLQYLENPYELLEKVVKLSPVGIIIDRTPLFSKGEIITVQHVPKNIYSASYPCRFLNKARIEKILSNNRKITPWFASPVDPNNFFGVLSLVSKNNIHEEIINVE